MALVLNGSANTIGGLAVGGVPDGTIDADALAANAVTSAKILDSNVTSGKLASGVGGKVLQVKFDSTSTQTSSSGWGTSNMVDTGLSCSLTPASTSNKILIEWTGVVRGNASNSYVSLAIKRNDTLLDLGTGAGTDGYFMYASAFYGSPGGWAWLDESTLPSGELTYKIVVVGYPSTGVAYHVGTGTWDVNTLTVSEISA